MDGESVDQRSVFPSEAVTFKHKIETGLYEMAKAKAAPVTMSFSTDGQSFVVTGSDQKIRVFRFATGKLRRIYDERLSVFESAQRDGTLGLDSIDFSRRNAVEREMQSLVGQINETAPCNAVFDESGNFLIYSTLAGIKVVNIATNKLARVLGKTEASERFTCISIFQGSLKVDSQYALATGGSSAATKAQDSKSGKAISDPTVFAASFRSKRFYLFTTREPTEGDGDTARDVFNEKPSAAELALAAETNAQGLGGANALGREATIHTTMGDIVITLFANECPRTIENFCGHARSSYYDDIIFHRVIKGFMVQTGDPLGDGTGGESIWGGEFQDEFHRNLRHDRAFTVSMANAGPNTNGSQFFITCVPTPWLDNKHTVFGRVTKGMQTIKDIENVRVNKMDKPLEPIKIINITIK